MKSKLDAIILCGGLGTRLRSVVYDVPKPLAKVNQTPFLDILINYINTFDSIGNIILAAGHLGGQIKDRYSSYKNIITIIEDTPLGTGGAMMNSVKEVNTNEFFLINGDSYIDEDLDVIAKFHSSNNNLITLTTRYQNDTERFGSLIFDNKTQQLEKFIEKNNYHRKGFINCGLYIFNREWTISSFTKESFSLEQEMQLLTPINKAKCFISKKDFIDIGTVKSYKDSKHFFRER